MLRVRRKWVGICLAVVLLYLLSYVALSALGAYRPDISGGTRFPGGVGITDCELWQPLLMYYKRYLSVDGTRHTRADPLGYFYAPLIAADRAWVHKSHYLFD